MNRRMALACMSIGVAALCAPAVVQLPARLVYNPSDSVPRGWYRIGSPDSLHVGGVVLVRLPAGVATLAAQRGYLPTGVPLLKRIGAVAAQSVCVRAGGVRIDGMAVAAVLAEDGSGRLLSPWAQCRTLAVGELFLLSNVHPASFDSRYFGPVDASAVIGSAHPLWTWGTP
ncbi:MULTISPECIES: S26 family signal peptidase [unclassified Acidovorax]|uniref:S26 family signal peptidase n=1 Tax=unclassified Acidovorax TaxID=2684926 RepID=UPI001C496D7C|nr:MULTISPECIES: S26 family signal peptidase [unclassified Acidovorax]MBV7460299.1 S26 family signal peptidase [Acidovorax sp. sif0632]MBV7465324.1 S26 family signal peptidase [Acidovorax sp. sif0613]